MNELRSMGDHFQPPREKRREVEMRGYLVRSDNEIVDVRVLDLSYDGCGIDTPTQLVAGEEVKLSVLARGALTATVRWATPRSAGLIFATEPAARKEQARHAERVTVAAKLFLRRSSKLGYEVQALDLSCWGAKCEFVERPMIDEIVWIKLNGLEALEARVCWVEGFQTGLKFLRPIHPAVFDMLTQRLR